jgi:general secretion pathway protein G
MIALITDLGRTAPPVQHAPRPALQLSAGVKHMAPGLAAQWRTASVPPSVLESRRFPPLFQARNAMTMKPHQVRRNETATRRGFSIIELMGVLALIGILAGISALAIPAILAGAQRDSTRESMKVIEGALDLYSLQNKGTLPPTGQLSALLSASLVKSQSDLEDAWGRPFQYYSPSVVQNVNVDWLLVSLGKNGIDDAGAGDDIWWYPGATE